MMYVLTEEEYNNLKLAGDRLVEGLETKIWDQEMAYLKELTEYLIQNRHLMSLGPYQDNIIKDGIKRLQEKHKNLKWDGL